MHAVGIFYKSDRNIEYFSAIFPKKISEIFQPLSLFSPTNDCLHVFVHARAVFS